MKKSNKIILLVLTLLPLILIPVIVSWAIGGAMQMEHMEDPESGIAAYVGGLVFWAILAGVISLVTWIYYLVHAINNQSIDSNERLVWILLFIFVSPIPQVVYFFMRIWNLPEPQKENQELTTS